MLFPNTPRVKYDKNTLIEVSCQICFPVILKIDSEPPAEFQEFLRSTFPFYSRQFEQASRPSAVNQLDARGDVIKINISTNHAKLSHRFQSADKNWQFKLTNSDLTLSCRKYDHWEQFRDKFCVAFKSLSEIYRPALYSHVCVRYKNAIHLTKIGLPPELPWSEFLQPCLLGPLLDPTIASNTINFQARSSFQRTDSEGKLEATYGLGVHPSSDVKAFLIETHVFNDNVTGSEDVIEKLSTSSRLAGLFFRWCITDRLHVAMGPKSLE